MRKLFFCIAIFFCALQSKATHIVGGEFELIHLNGNTYLLRLTQYFDDVNGNQSILFDTDSTLAERNITVSIFRNSDDALVTNVILFRNENINDFVPYTNPSCEPFDDSGEPLLVTRRIIFESQIVLSPDVYNELEGYYISWERCCRNGTISNVVNPGAAGQTFLLEFPPVSRNGRPFINSSPSIFPPLSDFACAGQFYFADFSGFDSDGDSLVYTMALPLNGNSDQTNPAPQSLPKPYPTVNFIDGIRVDNQIRGDPALSISTDGILTVVPSATSLGLNVFAVKVEEFRNGLKIGEVRRDFQLLILDCVLPGVKPEIRAESQSGSSIENQAVVTFAADEQKCFNIFLRDQDPNEVVSIRARPVNFSAVLDTIFDNTGGPLTGPSDERIIEVCLPDCPFTSDLAIIDFIVTDNSCPQPLLDTLRLSFDIEGPPNELPVWSENNFSVMVDEGDAFDTTFRSIDPDGELIDFFLRTDGFFIEDFGIEIDTVRNEAGQLDVRFFWDTNCQVFDFTERDSFNFRFSLDDQDTCLLEDRVDLNFRIDVNLPPNTLPVLSTSVDITESVNLLADNTFSFDIFATDSDGDSLILTGIPLNYEFADFDATFEDQEGIDSVSSSFSISATCEDLTSEPLRTFFQVEDNDRCKFTNEDSLLLQLNVVGPPNDPPFLSFSSGVIRDTIFAGEEFRLEVFGEDINNNPIELLLRRATGFEERTPFSFEDVSGIGAVSSELVWQTTCDDLGEDLESMRYSFSFGLEEDACGPDSTAVQAVIVEVVNREAMFEVDTLYNVLTPNFDGYNDTFRFKFGDLPLDNCFNQFEGVTVVNRWGKAVFESSDRNFEWDGGAEPNGIYYYSLKFTQEDYTSWLQLLR
ncbi:MAG: gliding motility-associated C-terminal domain-containing protein [Bacteroidota bacterium]